MGPIRERSDLLDLDELCVQALQEAIGQSHDVAQILRGHGLHHIPHTGAGLHIKVGGQLHDLGNESEGFGALGDFFHVVLDAVVAFRELHGSLEVQIQAADLLEPVGNALLARVELRQGVVSGLLGDFLQGDGILHITGHSQDGVEAFVQSNVELEDAVRGLLADFLAVDVQNDGVLVGVDLDLGGLACALCVAAASDVDHRGLGPVSLIDKVAVLLGLAVHGDEALVVAAAHAALVTGSAAEVEHVPDVGSPHPGTVLEDLCHVLVVQCLILLGVVLALRRVAVPVDDALAAVLGNADADVGVVGVELVQPGAVLLHLAAVPAEVVVVALQVGDVVHGAVHGGMRNVSNGGQAGRVKLLAELFQIVVGVHQLLRDAADQDLVGDAPEHDGGVVVVLDDELLHLLHDVGVCALALLEDADEGDLSPDGETDLVAGIVEVLAVLIVCQTDGVGAQLLDEHGVLIVLFGGQRVALEHAVLMAGNAAQRGGHTVDGEAFVGRDLEGTDTDVGVDLIDGLVVALQGRSDGVQVGLVHAPQLCVGHVDGDFGLGGAADSGSDLAAEAVLDAVQNGQVVSGVGDEALDGEVCTAILRGDRGDHDAGAAVVVQIKVCIGHADQVDAAVQAAVEGEVGGSGVHGRGVLVGDLDGQLVLTLVAQIGDIGTEDGEAALMGGGDRTVDLHGGVQCSSEHLNIGAAALTGLLGLLEGAGVNAGGAQVAAVAVVAVHSVPGVGQVDLLRHMVALGEGQGPVFVQGNDLSH